MVCCEMFFLPTSCRWSSVLLFDHVGIVSCFRCNIRHKLCTWADKRCFSVGINWCLRWGSLVCCISFLLCCVKGLVSECRTCGRFALGCFLSWRFPWFFGLAGLRWTGFWDNATLLSVFGGLFGDSAGVLFHVWCVLDIRWGGECCRSRGRVCWMLFGLNISTVYASVRCGWSWSLSALVGQTGGVRKAAFSQVSCKIQRSFRRSSW